MNLFSELPLSSLDKIYKLSVDNSSLKNFHDLECYKMKIYTNNNDINNIKSNSSNSRKEGKRSTTDDKEEDEYDSEAGDEAENPPFIIDTIWFEILYYIIHLFNVNI